MGELIFEWEFDPADHEKVGGEAWERLRREFATLYAAEMKKPGDEAFEDPFGVAVSKLREEFGVAKPPEEE